jgi:alkaline phosphatase D
MRKLWLIFYFIPVLVAEDRPVAPSVIISGPMPGRMEPGTSIIWMQASTEVQSVSLENLKKADSKTRKLNNRYQYRFLLNDIPSDGGGFLHTEYLWQLRRPAPDFSFLRGSCACFKDLVYDRPGKSFSGDSMIFSEKQLIP